MNMPQPLPTARELKDIETAAYVLRGVDLPTLERMMEIIEAQQNEIGTLMRCLSEIRESAHQKSTGPAVPDGYWEIRELAEEAIS